MDSVRETPELMELLKEVNTEVQKYCHPAEEAQANHWWSRNIDAWASCDCKGYALTKKVELMKRGVPSGALRVVRFGNFSKGVGGHAFLMVKTSQGLYVLDDNLLFTDVYPFYDALTEYQRAGYYFDVIQDQNGRWITGAWWEQYGDVPMSLTNPGFVAWRRAKGE